MEVDNKDVEPQKQQTSRKLQKLSDDVVMRNWNNPSSRIIRVSRASGGKDRHSKVLTSKGLRDRRIRLSVATAIQFYDLQDRLGFDQPSKAVEWLINAAADSISDLPPINTNFDDHEHDNKNQTKSAGSSGTSESSLLSLSRTGEAREKAREKTVNPPQSSFAQLLTGRFDEPNRNNWTGNSDCFNPVQLIPNSSLHQFNTNHNHFSSLASDYNFGISSSECISRGTLQSNSQSLFLNNNITRQSSSPMDTQSLSFFTAATPPPSFDGRLYLNHGEGNRNLEEKEIGKKLH